jgi:hypothetical protein
MAGNRTRADNLHQQMPAAFNTQVNPNWKALIDAIGASDQDTLDLIEGVRDQFFIKTASRPYIDKLGAAVQVQRPKFVGMEDSDFKRLIPVLSYQPKQVKLILDELLDLFFFKESTTAFISSNSSEPFMLQDGWELEYNVDNTYNERIIFTASNFTNIAIATANEIVAVINRQATNSYAISFINYFTKQTNIKIFSKTIGAKGSIEVTGGRVNIGLQFEGYNAGAGQGVGTQWQVTKIGDTAYLRYTGIGGTPNIDMLQIGDVVMINRVGNIGSFVIEAIDPVSNIIQYTNLFATPETFISNVINDVKFFTPHKSNITLIDKKAAVWEIRSGEIIVEMPPSPPVVKRKRPGSAHINGTNSFVTNTIDQYTMTVVDASTFPASGRFFFIPKNEIQTYFPAQGDTTYFQYNSKLSSDLPIYTYTSVVGNTLYGISPALPALGGVNRFNLVSANRDASNALTCITTTPHNYVVGQSVTVLGAVLGTGTGTDVNGAWKVSSVINATSFTCTSFSGPSGTRASTGGSVASESVGLANAGSQIIISTAMSVPGKYGPYMWDTNANFVISSLTANLTTSILAGTAVRNIEVTANSILDTECKIMFDFGTEKQEGPVRCFYKPNSTSLAIDPSYVFQFPHIAGSAVTMIRSRGGIQFGGLGTEYAGYITDPASARIVLENLMQEVKSVGIFINFLVRYPHLYYGTIDVYKSGVTPS